MLLPNRRFDLVLIDPPWKYAKRSNRRTKFGLGASQEDLMSIKEIKALPVANIAKPESILLMWTTMPMLHDALTIMEGWGFEYKTVAFTWVKVNKLDRKPVFGIGFYTKSNAELCLLGGRGGHSIKPRNNDVSSMILSPPIEFSHKPEEVYRRIDRMYPDLRKVELFAKTPHQAPGWTQMRYSNPAKTEFEMNQIKAAKASKKEFEEENPPPGPEPLKPEFPPETKETA